MGTHAWRERVEHKLLNYECCIIFNVRSNHIYHINDCKCLPSLCVYKVL